MTLKSRLCMHPADFAGTVPAVYHIETKIDGWRALGVGGKAPQLITQGGAAIKGAEAFLEVMAALERQVGQAYVFDGELVAGADFEETSRNIRNGDLSCAVWHIFDGLPLPSWRRGMNATMYDMRRRILEQAFADLTGRSSACVINHGGISVALLQRAGPFSGAAAADKVFDLAREKGAEGIVIKDSESAYRAGKSDGWYRRKVRETLDLQLLNICQGPGGRFGIVVDYEGSPVEIYAGLPEKVGGWNDGVVGGLVEIAHLGITSTGSLRSPSFLRWRTDKQETPHV